MEDKELQDIKELTQTLSTVTDYAVCMKMVTKYKPNSAPNILNVLRLLNRIKKEYKI